MKKYLIIFALMPLFASGQAEQEKWTLEQCISYGLQHNITRITSYNVCYTKLLR